MALFPGETSRCTCAAGTFGQPCYHAACAWLRSIADRPCCAVAQPRNTLLQSTSVDLEPWLATIAARDAQVAA